MLEDVVGALSSHAGKHLSKMNSLDDLESSGGP